MIVNFGSMNIDYVYEVEHIVRPGETISSGGLSVIAGGKGLNQSIAIARANGSIMHAGAYGMGGEFLKDTLAESGVDISALKYLPEEKNGHAIIQVDQYGENSIFLYEGTNRKVDRAYIDSTAASLKGDEIILFQNEISEIAYAMEKVKQSGCKIAFNPAPMNKKVLGYPLELVDIFIVNAVEGQEMFGSSNPETIVENCIKRYENTEIILTMGSKGALYAKGSERIYVQAERAEKVVDTTAAGDTFIGYFLACTDNGVLNQKALQTAARAAAISVSKKGAAVSIPDMDDVKKK